MAMHVLLSVGEGESGREDDSTSGSKDDGLNKEDEDRDSEVEGGDIVGDEGGVEENGEDEENSDNKRDGGGGGQAGEVVAEKALKAAINFVEVCCQHTAFIAGRGNISDELIRAESTQGKANFRSIQIQNPRGMNRDKMNSEKNIYMQYM